MFLYHEGGFEQVITMDWKGLRLKITNNLGAVIELYDLSKDIGGKKNIADKHPEIVVKITASMKGVHTPSGW